ncbi:MAG: ankyrin repeat domain-containing protein [Bacilli bacterium]|nr:ankyrin repeat domain-containing protein [Bacilli bacterium]
MFYDEAKAIKACEEEPSLIFELIREEHFELVDFLLTKGKVDINICDELGNNVLVRLLKKGQYELVLKHMKNKKWDVNHQNNEGNTFAHILVLYNYVNVLEIINGLKKNKNFMPNIKNNKGETILDKSINNNYIYTTIKILEDKRFNDIDIVSFKNLYDTYIKTNNYGKYTKLTNLQIIMDNLEEKTLLPNMKKLVNMVKANYDVIKEEVIHNKTNELDNIISNVLLESRA